MEYPIHHLKRSSVQSIFNPKEIWEVTDPPSELFIHGSEQALQLLQKIPERGLAVVGTRNPQTRSIALVKKWIPELSASDLIIVSGLARGIDAAAHSAALEAGLPTIAVLGAGLDLDYPRENHELRRRILEANGLVISEFPSGTPADGHHFLQRNRLIAGWSKATWVIEAGHPSGALSTARWAREQNRTCFATPCYPNDPGFSGNQTLLDRDHALAFWGVHSLGAAWIELAAQAQKRKGGKKGVIERPYSSSSGSKDELVLTQYVNVLTYQQGGAQVQELLSWAITRSWDPQRFFTALQSAVQQKMIIDQQGTLVSM